MAMPPPPPPSEARVRLYCDADLELRRLMAQGLHHQHHHHHLRGHGGHGGHGGLHHSRPSMEHARVPLSGQPVDLLSLQSMARGSHAGHHPAHQLESLNSLRSLRWYMGGRWPDSSEAFHLPLMMPALQPQAGSAFHRVVRSENLLPAFSPIPPSAAFQHEEKLACSVLKEECYSDNTDECPDSPDDIKETLLASCRTTGNELPLKKRKPRFSDVKMGEQSEQRRAEQLLNQPSVSNERGDQCQPIDIPACSLECSLKCLEMSKAEKEWSLASRFTSWNPLQVQLWLWKTLRDPKYSIPPRSICQVLKCIEDYDGNSLNTYGKEQWKEMLSGSGVSHEIVWEKLCDKRQEDSAPFKPYNYCGFAQQRENGRTNRMKTSPSTKTSKLNLVKKTTKPRRRRDKCVGQLWEFVFRLLEDKQTNPSVVCWEDKEKLLFRIVNTEEIARRWGAHKGNNNMTYANMSRTMRYYREGNGAFVRNERKRVYGFGPKADFARLRAKTARNLSQ